MDLALPLPESTDGLSPNRRVIAPVRKLAKALSVFSEQINQAQGELATMRLSPLLEELASYGAGCRGAACQGCIDSDLATLEEAWQIILQGLPVRPTGPEAGRYKRWKAPLYPHEVCQAFDTTTAEDTTTYLQAAHLNHDFYTRRSHNDAMRYQRSCSRGARDNCANPPIWFPSPQGTGYDHDMGCWQHLTPTEHDLAVTTYTGAVSDFACPGCDAAAGQPCYTGPDAGPHLHLVDGEWPRVRRYRGRQVHDARLIAYATTHPELQPDPQEQP